jgi:hypothetical protein
LAEKKEKKVDSFDARLFTIVIELVSKIGSSIPNEKLWEKILEKIPGKPIPNKPQSYDSEEFGPISKTKISSICEDRFGATKAHDGQQRILRFNKETLTKLAINYSIFDKIEILRDTNTSNTFNTFWEYIEDINNAYTDINKQKYTENYQHSSLDTSNSHSYNNKEEKLNNSIDSADSIKVLEPLEVLNNSHPKESKCIVEKIEETSIPDYIYRLGRTDIWGCKNCKFKDDIWFMKMHTCINTKNNTKNR